MVGLLRVLVLVVVLLQRFALPVGQDQVPMLVPVVSVLVLIGLRAGVFRVDRRRLVLVAIMIGTAAAVTIAQVVTGALPSLLSMGLLIVLYLPAVLSPIGDREAYRSVGRFFVGLMAFFAIVSLAQFALQALGRQNEDLLARFVPSQLLLQDFNTGNAVEYGSDLVRANAVVFLEPSFLSLFLGLAAVVALRLRLHWPVVTLLLLGIVPSVAGNGLVVLGGGVLVFVFLRGRRRLLALVPAAAAGIAVLAATPFGALYLQRSTEGGGANTSSGLRFVQPYVELIPPVLHEPLTALIGNGAGVANDYIVANRLGALLPTVLPKIAFEFGAIGVVGILLPLLVLLLAPLRKQPELLGLAVTYFVVNASFQAAVTVYLVTLFMLWLPDLAARPTPDPRAAPRSGTVAWIRDGSLAAS